jgi:hypothetical protein
MSVVPPTEIGFDTVGRVRRTNPFSIGTATDDIGLATASAAGEIEEIVVLEVAGPIAGCPSLIVPAWENDQHTPTVMAILIAVDHLMVCV